jgi:hypothetical protein
MRRSTHSLPREDCSFTVLAYGYQAELARRVLSRLAVEEEIFGELIVTSERVEQAIRKVAM